LHKNDFYKKKSFYKKCKVLNLQKKTLKNKEIRIESLTNSLLEEIKENHRHNQKSFCQVNFLNYLLHIM
jgi:hypothetical protein